MCELILCYLDIIVFMCELILCYLDISVQSQSNFEQTVSVSLQLDSRKLHQHANVIQQCLAQPLQLHVLVRSHGYFSVISLKNDLQLTPKYLKYRVHTACDTTERAAADKNILRRQTWSRRFSRNGTVVASTRTLSGSIERV